MVLHGFDHVRMEKRKMGGWINMRMEKRKISVLLPYKCQKCGKIPN